MGGMMSNPLTATHLQRRANRKLAVGSASMQGWRSDHEDAHILLPEWESDWSLFAVCDGHAGDRAANFVARHLPSYLSGTQHSEAKIVSAFLACDEAYRKERQCTDGTTVCSVMCRPNDDGSWEIIIANAGDSRCLVISPELADPLLLAHPGTRLSRSECVLSPTCSQATPCPTCLVATGLVFSTVDHKPDSPGERDRIVAAGGFVSGEEPARLDGVIAVSRVIGDFQYKSDPSFPPEKQKMIAVPDITRLKAKVGDVLVVACDGLFEVCESDEVARQVSARLLDLEEGSPALLGSDETRSVVDLALVAAEVLHTCLHWDTKDNMTMLIIKLLDISTASSTLPISATFANPPFDEELLLGDYLQRTEHRERYEAFFKRADFPTQPAACEVCGRLFKSMSQCPCRDAVYCGVVCQKKGWKDHKKNCSIRGKKGK